MQDDNSKLGEGRSTTACANAIETWMYTPPIHLRTAHRRDLTLHPMVLADIHQGSLHSRILHATGVCERVRGLSCTPNAAASGLLSTKHDRACIYDFGTFSPSHCSASLSLYSSSSSSSFSGTLQVDECSLDNRRRGRPSSTPPYFEQRLLFRVVVRIACILKRQAFQSRR
jgi:hypothetical protein